MRMRPMRPAGLPLLAVVALAGCGDSEIDTADAERFVRGVVVEQVGARVASVACPQDAGTEAGARFTCAVTGADGSRGAASVTRTDDGGLEVDVPFLHVRQAERTMALQIAEQLEADEVEVSCPEIVVVERDRLFTCRATGAARPRDVAVRLTDDAGRFRFRVS